MSIKTKAGQIWTDSVAYVALGLGAATSMAGNAANVLRVRGDATDGLDLFLAVFFPGLVVLMVEVFVSSRWRGLHWSMQVLRWLGCAAVTAVAMRVSWVHLHALMLSRGQEADVAILGPLAIDFLAIMATALILAGRGRSVPVDVQDSPAPLLDTPREMTKDEADEILERWAELDRTAPPVDMAKVAKVDSIADEARTWLDTLADADGGQEPTLPVPVSPAPSSMVKPDSVPDSAVDMIQAWAIADPADRPAVGQVDALVAAAHNRSTKTARRWRATVLAG